MVSATQRAASVLMELNKLEKYSSKEPLPLSHFHFTSTVRKLPSSATYQKQQIYENRSPLHTVHNVQYKFNSTSTRFNLHEWGLEAMPERVANIAKIIGFNADYLFTKMKSFKFPSKLLKVKNEPGVQVDGEEVEETRSSFFTNAMTQTDEVTVLNPKQIRGKEIAIQVKPHMGSIGTQTSGPVSSTIHIHSANADLPLMAIINEMNEYQLLALNDFAELIKEPATSAMDVYRLRQRMLDIYKTSQQTPSGSVASTFGTLNSAALLRGSTSPPIMNCNEPNLPQIESVYSMPTQSYSSATSSRDPRQKAVKYFGRGAHRR